MIISIFVFIKHRHLRTEKNFAHMITLFSCGLRTLVDLVSDVFHESVKVKSDQIKRVLFQEENETSLHSRLNSQMVYEQTRNDQISYLKPIFIGCLILLKRFLLCTVYMRSESVYVRNGYHFIVICSSVHYKRDILYFQTISYITK